MNLFICSTAFQIFNAINLSNTIFKTEQCDIYIMDYNYDCIKIYERLREKQVFRNIYLIKVRKRYIVKKTNKYFNIVPNLKKLYNAFNYKSIEKYIPNKNEIYNQILIGGPELASQLIYYYFSSKCKTMKLSLFEEGIYSYYVLGIKPNKIRKMISKILFRKYYLDQCKSIYTYNSKIVDDSYKKVDKIDIPKINKKCKDTVDFFNEVTNFHFKDIDLLNKDYIFLETGFEDVGDVAYQNKILNLLTKYINKDNLLIKLHPKTELNKSLMDNQVKTQSSLELIAMNKNFNENILISTISSASFNLKLIYDEEPYVIMLCKLFEFDLKYPYLNSFIEKVRLEYKTDKFFIPKNEEELVTILNKISAICNETLND